MKINILWWNNSMAHLSIIVFLIQTFGASRSRLRDWRWGPRRVPRRSLRRVCPVNTIRTRPSFPAPKATWISGPGDVTQNAENVFRNLWEMMVKCESRQRWSMSSWHDCCACFGQNPSETLQLLKLDDLLDLSKSVARSGEDVETLVVDPIFMMGYHKYDHIMPTSRTLPSTNTTMEYGPCL